MTLRLAAALLLLPAFLVLAARAGEERAPAGRFVAHETCALCHDETRRGMAMRDAAGRNVAPVDLWRASPMANAARDPLWRAILAAEVAATPSRADAIEALCLRCHAPMGPRPGRRADLEAPDADGAAAGDGVSCTVCHGILADGLGTAASFSGGWVADEEGRLFGPHAAPFGRPMMRHTGYVPTASEHVLEPALCGSCHTLFTHALGAGGEEADATLPEQTPYLEWRNSIYTTETELPWPEAATCRDCHVPTLDEDGLPIRTRIAHNPGGRDFPPTRARAPFGRHHFVGANTLVGRLLADSGAAPPEAFQAAERLVRASLATAASLDLAHLAVGGGVLELDLRIENRAGHKLPTAHPTRRVWLRLEILDGDGSVLFASGAWDASGRIVDADGRPLASERAGGPLSRHVDVVRGPDDVAVYEARMEDAAGRATWLLTRGARFARDDRLLPKGWKPDGPHASDTRPAGVEGDADFVAGGDVVHVRIPFDPPADGPFVVRARLVHQVLGARWAAELGLDDTFGPALAPTEIARLEARVEGHAR